MCFLLFLFACLLFQESSSFCRENEIFKNKKQKKQNMDQVLTYKKANIGPALNSTAYIYIYAVELLSEPRLASWGVIIWAKFVFTKMYQNAIKYIYIYIFRHIKKEVHLQGLVSWPTWSFLCCNKLGPDNNPYLAQIITSHDVFLSEDVLKNPSPTVLFEHQNKFARNWAKKTMIFHIFKARVINKNVLLQPPISPTMCLLSWHFLKTKALLLHKNTTQDLKNTKMKGHLKDKSRQDTKKQKGLMKETFAM